MSEKKLYLATSVDRLWHVIHALGIVSLALSGFNIHFSKEFQLFTSFQTAVEIHNIIGLLVACDWIVWAIYNSTSRRIKFFIPNKDDMPTGLIKQAIFYLKGIFTGAPHPFPVTVNRKFNPLQKWTYLSFMTLIVPFQIVTGIYLLAMIASDGEFSANKVYLLSILHLCGAFIIAAFILGHIYLATTGDKVWSHFKYIVTGYHEEDNRKTES